jgi:hypothetical protein
MVIGIEEGQRTIQFSILLHMQVRERVYKENGKVIVIWD